MSVNKARQQTVSLLLVNNHAMFREALAGLFYNEPDFFVVGQCGSLSEASATLKKSRPRVVLLDIDVAADKILDFVLKSRKDGFTGGVLVLTGGISGEHAIEFIGSGVSGILHKQRSGDDLLSVIRYIAAGGAFLETDYLRSLFEHVNGGGVKTSPLTEKERQLLRLLCQGSKNREIAEQLDISEGAVKNSLHRLSHKLGARTRAQLVGVAMEQYRKQL